MKSPDTTAKLEDVAGRLLFMEEALNDYIDVQNREFNTIKEEVIFPTPLPINIFSPPPIPTHPYPIPQP